MPQNLLNVVFDIPKLQASKAEAQQEVASFYEFLSNFDNKKITPLNITGLTELNASTVQLNQNFTTLQENLSKVISLMSQYSAQSAASSSVVKNSSRSKQTEEELKYIQLLKESNATADAVAKQQIELEKKQAAETISAEKQKQKAIKDTEAQRLATSAENKKINAEQTAILQKSIKEQKSATQQSLVDQKQKEKEDIQEAKNMLLLDDSYKQLIIRQRELSNSYANIILQGGQNTPFGKQVRDDLKGTSQVISDVDKKLEAAGAGGALSFGKSLTEALSSLRTIAYILPGIGIAGIFNLAFEAIEKVAEATGIFNDKIKDEIELEKSLADYAAKTNSILNDRATAFEK